MKILYIISIYNIIDGASSALYSQIQIDNKLYSDYLAVADTIESKQDDLKLVYSRDREIIIKFINTDERVVVHYIKARNSSVLYDTLKFFKRLPPVVLQCVQSPSFYPWWISPFELKVAWHIVFIDKSSYMDALIQFIPNSKRSAIYCSSYSIYGDYSNVPTTDNHGRVVFGRGSSFDKIPKNVLEVFDKINVPNKLFRIVGVGQGDNWLRRACEGRDDIELIPKQPLEDWQRICNSFDVFLYQLPDFCYASIDATLGLAMLLRKPCVYMGAPAPKERFHKNNENGFIANSVDEMAKYATMLGLNPELRKIVGEKGRETTIQEFRPEIRIAAYKIIYEHLEKNEKFHIPIGYRYNFYKKNRQQLQIILNNKCPFLYQCFQVLFRVKYKLLFLFNLLSGRERVAHGRK